MVHSIELSEIAARTRLPLRKIRYVLDQRLLPGTRGKLQTHMPGQPRSLTPLEAFYVATAALMLEGGIRRQTVIQFFDRLMDMPWPFSKGRTGLHSEMASDMVFYKAGEPLDVLLGDGVNLRVIAGNQDSGWVEPHRWTPLSAGYRPASTIRVDFVHVHDLFGRRLR